MTWNLNLEPMFLTFLPYCLILNLSHLPRVVCGLLTSALPGWNREPLEGQGPEPAAVSSMLYVRGAGSPQVALDR